MRSMAPIAATDSMVGEDASAAALARRRSVRWPAMTLEARQRVYGPAEAAGAATGVAGQSVNGYAAVSSLTHSCGTHRCPSVSSLVLKLWTNHPRDGGKITRSA